MLIDLLKSIGSVAEERELKADEWQVRYTTEKDLEKVYEIEERYWQQVSNVNCITKGDANTSFFPHSCANGRRRKKNIFSLEHEGIYFDNEKDIVDHIYNFYKNLFGFEGRQAVGLSDDDWRLRYRVSEEDSNNLLQDFFEEEVWKAIKELPSDLAPRLDGFPTIFYKKF